MATPAQILQQIEMLPSEGQREVENLVLRLKARYAKAYGGPIDLSWAGRLEKYRDKYTAHDLKKKALEWRFKTP